LFERCCGPIAGRSNATCPSSTSFRVTGLAIAHSVTAAHPPDQPITSAVRGGASLDEVYDNAPAVCVTLYKQDVGPHGATSCVVGGEDLPRRQAWDGGSARWRRSPN
jgi:hypothetical protein